MNPDRNTTNEAEIGRILNDYLDRKARGTAEPQSQLLARHPELAQELQAHLELVGELRPQRSTIETLIAQGVLSPADDPDYLATLGSYKISGLIGRGGMGIVLKAYEESLNRTVALKILRPELADDIAVLARFTREARSAAALKHPNIVTVHAVGREGNTHFLAMEYVDGPSLAQLIQRHGPLPAEITRTIFRQILQGLAAAHEEGLIHRDIKPANILLYCPGQHTLDNNTAEQDDLPAPEDIEAKLADFGLARLASSTTQMTMAGALLGTPEYMSPEQARGDDKIDHRSDLYSAGAVLYEMLTGQPPFKASTPTATIHRVVNDISPDPCAINIHADFRLARLAERLIAKKKNDRLQSTDAVLISLDAERPIQPFGRRCHPMRRMQLISRIGMLVGVLLIASVVISQNISYPKPITAVRIDPDLPSRLQARYGDDSIWKQVHDFGTRVDSLVDPVLVKSGDGDNIAIAVGVSTPIDTECLLLLNQSGQQLWGLDLSSNIQWPDCSPPTPHKCLTLAAGDIDGRPGDEIVAVSTHLLEYPTSLSIINPLDRSVGSTFMHMGEIQKVVIVEDFFAPGHPAIVAKGINNKMDGFSDGLRPGEKQLADYEYVTVLMILDPERMDGLGPPRTQRLANHIKEAMPFAYAILNLPYMPEMPQVRLSSKDQLPVRNLPEHGRDWRDVGEIGNLISVDQLSPGREDFKLHVPIDTSTIGETRTGRAILTVNQNLELLHVAPTIREQDPADEQYWRLHWKVIIREYEYVGGW